MSVTLPRITYGWLVQADVNDDLPFDRGGNKDAVLRPGCYIAADFATEVARAMNAADTGQTYTCVYSFSTRKFTIDNGATAITLEFSRNASTNCAGLLGFDDADTSSSAGGHTSTDTVGDWAGDATDYFRLAGVYSWAPTDPVESTTPVTAAADGNAASNLQRVVHAVQNKTDGGRRETVHFSTDKILRLRFRYLVQTGTPTEVSHMERLLDWIEKGRPINYQPSTASDNALRLILRDPGEIANAFSWRTRTELDYPELTFVEQLSRT